MYFIWEESYKNKDEYMTLNTANKVGGNNNPYCGQFEYKADMEPAIYELPVKTTESFSALSIWLKDASLVDSRIHYLEAVNVDLIIYAEMETEEIYAYEIPVVDKIWNEYVIPFASFSLTNRDYLPFIPNPLSSGGITRIGISLQYYYMDSTGQVENPLYTDDNVVYIDNMYYTHDTVASKTLREKVIVMDGDLAPIDDFESYANNDELENVWIDGRDYSYQHKELSTDVSSEGGHKSMALSFKADSDSPSYLIAPAIDRSVNCSGIRFSLKCAKSIKVFFNLYMKIGTSNTQYRITLDSINTAWTEYTIALSNNNFEKISGTSIELSGAYIKNIYRISFGMSFYDGTYAKYQLLVDNVYFDNTIPAGTYSTRVIG